MSFLDKLFDILNILYYVITWIYFTHVVSFNSFYFNCFNGGCVDGRRYKRYKKRFY